jgi:transposase
MGQNFIVADRDQVLLLPPSLRDWLPQNHLAWSILGAVEEMDLSAFYGAYRDNGQGRAAYEPSMMVALLLYAYARGNRSSRGIERECREDVAYRVLAANLAPDHSTIAEFRRRHEAALAGLFGEVLLLCREAGMVKVGVLAVDGTKVAANASSQANRDYEQLAREILQDAARIDAEEDALYGERRGDELPEQLTTEHGRRAWFREAKRRLDEQRAKEAQPIPRSRPARVKEAKDRLQEELWSEQRANAAYEAWRARGISADGARRMAPGTVKPYVPPDIPQGRINVTDPDSRTMKKVGGYLQGYNAQTVVTEDQVIVAAEISIATQDFGHLGPVMSAARAELTGAGVKEQPALVLADAGYWHSDQMDQLAADGIPVLIPPDASKRRGERPGWSGGRYAWMRALLTTELGTGLYRRRQAMIEPVFGQIKFNRRIDRFQRRGRAAARSEWRLVAATHNLLKLHSRQLAVCGV